MRAILIEVRSIGGLSGSPVFVHMGGFRVHDGRPSFDNSDRPFLLCGLIHGHWDALNAEVDADILGTGNEKINTGIAIVVPADEISRVFDPILGELVAESSALLDAESGR